MLKFIIPLLMFIPICAFAQAGHIAPDDMVILATDYPHKSTWTPTDEDVQMALLKISEFIDNPSGVNDFNNNEIIKIKKKFSSYKVQFVGVEFNGEKRIWCNFFCSDSFDYWKKNVVIVDDGGFCFGKLNTTIKLVNASILFQMDMHRNHRTIASTGAGYSGAFFTGIVFQPFSLLGGFRDSMPTR